MLKRFVVLVLVVAGVVLVLPARAFAHSGDPCGPYTLHRAWNWDPLILGGMFVAGVLYARGTQVQWRRGWVHPWRIFAFTAGLMALFLALISPIHGVSESLFAGHMIQHMLLIVVAAPLLVYSMPIGPMLLALPPATRLKLGRGWARAGTFRKVWRVMTVPVIAWFLHVAVLWAWHAPVFYEAAVRDEAMHALEHASFFITALLFWWSAVRGQGNMSLGHGVIRLFTMAMVTGLLGALLTFSSVAWYAPSIHAPALWGLTPIEDQQLAGLIMWIPAGMVYMGVALGLFAAWLSKSERDADVRDGKWQGAGRAAK